jgi:PAS domain-containing protein
VQNSSDVIILSTPAAVITFVSPSASRVLHYDPVALVGQVVLRPHRRRRPRPGRVVLPRGDHVTAA